MVSTVQPWNFFLRREVERLVGDVRHLICSWMRASVLGSTLAVASSRTRFMYSSNPAAARHEGHGTQGPRDTSGP